MSFRQLTAPAHLAVSVALLAALASLSAATASGQASFSPFALVSGSPPLELQANYAYDPALSSNGAYVAYTGAIASEPGIYRTNLAHGDEEEIVARGADTGVPSISPEGRYVSFTTDDNPLTGAPTGRCSAVYVRDMDIPLPEPPPEVKGGAQRTPEEEAAEYGFPAITLVSARNESSESLTYPTPVVDSQTCGSAAAYRVALSDEGPEGMKVAFTVLSPSDLTGGVGQTETPPDQIAVRDLKTKRTELVSVTRASLGGAGEPVPGGAALAGPSIVGGVIHPTAGSSLPVSASTAAISADGSTVAWMGIDVQEQIELATAPPTGGHANGFAEPLWRKIEEGPSTPTRSVLAGGDASAAQCPPSCSGGLDLLYNEGIETTNIAGPIYGSFLAAQGFTATGAGMDPLDVITPQLSESGNTVALLSTQPTYGEDPKYPIGANTAPPTANAFVVNMTPGLTRAQSIARLTAWATLELANVALAGPIQGIAISPDGTHVAFITQRIAFPLAPPALLTPPLSQAADSQLYDVDLAAGTMQLVSEGDNGQPAERGVFDVSLNRDGSMIAVGSASSNLAYGTANEGSDVFVTHELLSPPGPGQQMIGPPPSDLSTTPPWNISATYSHAKDGALLIDVSVPAAGSLSASASAAVPVAVKSATGDSRGRPRTSSRLIKREAIRTRRVASHKSTVRGPGVVQLTLLPARSYSPLTHAPAGLYANIELTFTVAGRPRLTQEFHASFVAAPPRRRTKTYAIPTGAHSRARGR
jgi:hypothetical protein